jgi:uncharacterized protein (DUF2126 family)
VADPSSAADPAEFEAAVANHDAALDALGFAIWLGNEPTFTDRHSGDLEWVSAALGEDKLARAEKLLALLAGQCPGAVVLRSIGRQYPGEPLPRWSMGLYRRRDAAPVWSGPPDPLVAGSTEWSDVTAFHAGLEAAFRRRDARCRAFATDGDGRLVVARDPSVVLPDPALDARLSRPSIHAGLTPAGGLRDDLAACGALLFIVSAQHVGGGSAACVDLPAFDDVRKFLAALDALAEAAQQSGLRSLVLRGFPPPVDATVGWTTVTPDPAVVEVNMAPHRDVRSFLEDNRRVYAAAAKIDLAPYRLHYNGTVADSGGGGQITFGGRSPEESPFFVRPRLLPRLIRYVLRHPSLSYLFAHDSIGGSGQSVRPDEHGLDALAELQLALALIDRVPNPSPSLLWQSLAPSLTDPVGNGHRAELNIEKLWNSGQPGRGQLGLVEFRAFRMQHTPERGATLAVLLRSILAMLIQRTFEDSLPDWGASLHDRFALPHYLEADLQAILDDLEDAGLPLAPVLRSELVADHGRLWMVAAFEDFVLTVRQAIDFWSLVGDATQQEGTSRLVDASTRRIEIAVRPKTRAAAEGLDALQLRVESVVLPMRTESDGAGIVRLFGVRYRGFAPRQGTHPLLKAQDPLRLVLVVPGCPDALEVHLHEWRPDHGAYDRVPATFADASARRASRAVTRVIPTSEVGPHRTAPPESLTPFSLDLRYLSDGS